MHCDAWKPSLPNWNVEGWIWKATLERFEEGSKLLERCQAELKEAEGRLENLRLPEAEAMIEEAKKE